MGFGVGLFTGVAVGQTIAGAVTQQPSNAIPARFDTTPTIVPTAVPVMLGEIEFSAEELPDRMPIGSAEQMKVQHNLPGGGIVTHDFGNKPRPIAWTGRFWGPNIDPRIQQISLYKLSAQDVLFSYGKYQCYVQVHDFDPGFGGGFNEYSITLWVTGDANGMFATPSTPSVDAQVADLMSQASLASAGVLNIDPTAPSALTQALQQLQAVLADAAPLALNLISSAPTILPVAAATLGTVQAYQASIPANSPQAAPAQVLADSVQGVYKSVQQGDAPAAHSIQGGDLFRVAAMQYGDPSLAFALAAANGLSHPILPSNVRRRIALPNLSST